VRKVFTVFRAERIQGRVKLLSAAGSAAALFNGIKESWRLARKILFLVLTVIREILTLLAILHSEIAKKILLPAALSNLTRPRTTQNIKLRRQLKFSRMV